MSLNKWLLLIFVVSLTAWVYLVFNKEIEDRYEEHKPRDWKHYCTVENPDSNLCWAGEKAPWVGGPFCHNSIPQKNQAPGTAVKCRTKTD